MPSTRFHDASLRRNQLSPKSHTFFRSWSPLFCCARQRSGLTCAFVQIPYCLPECHSPRHRCRPRYRRRGPPVGCTLEAQYPVSQAAFACECTFTMKFFWTWLIDMTLLVSRGERQEETGGEKETREALPGFHQIEPTILPWLHPAPCNALRRHLGAGEGCA